MFSQDNVIYKIKNPQNLKLAENAIPNFWFSAPDSCKAEFNLTENGETTIKLNCSGNITEFKMNFPIVMDYVDVPPAEGSSFVLEKRNLNYTTNPDSKLHIKMNYTGNDELKVIIQARDFVWNEEFIINFEKEIACLKGSECENYSVGNENTTILENYLRENVDLRPYLQELVEKIVKDKDNSLEMAKVASIFLKCWLQDALNVKKLYSAGLIKTAVFIVHCPFPEGCIICKIYRDGDVWCWASPYCRKSITDP